MLAKIKMAVTLLACVVAASSLQPAFAQDQSNVGTITQISTGWNSETFGIETTAPMINPAGCSVTDMYEVSSTSPGYNTYYAAALTAFSTGSQVVVVVSTAACTMSRPTIIGITVIPSS